MWIECASSPGPRPSRSSSAAPGWPTCWTTCQRNPLPDAFVATVEDNRPEWLESLRVEAGGWPKVEHVQLDSEWARRLDAALRVGRTLTLLLAALLACALVAVTFNTIRLQILTRREEIEVSKLIGATKPFIRRPFLYFGAIQGLAGGLTAWLVVAAGRVDPEPGPGCAGASSTPPPGGFGRCRLPDAATLLAFSAGLGWLGAWLSVSRHLCEPVPGLRRGNFPPPLAL